MLWSKAPVQLSQIFLRLFTIETIEQPRTILNQSTSLSFLSKKIGITYIIFSTICIFLGNCSHFVLLILSYLASFAKCPQKVKKRSWYIFIKSETHSQIFWQIVTHCNFIIPIRFRLFAITEFISIVNNREKYSAKWDLGRRTFPGARSARPLTEMRSDGWILS